MASSLIFDVGKLKIYIVKTSIALNRVIIIVIQLFIFNGRHIRCAVQLLCLNLSEMNPELNL